MINWENALPTGQSDGGIYSIWSPFPGNQGKVFNLVKYLLWAFYIPGIVLYARLEIGMGFATRDCNN